MLLLISNFFTRSDGDVESAIAQSSAEALLLLSDHFEVTEIERALLISFVFGSSYFASKTFWQQQALDCFILTVLLYKAIECVGCFQWQQAFNCLKYIHTSQQLYCVTSILAVSRFRQDACFSGNL